MKEKKLYHTWETYKVTEPPCLYKQTHWQLVDNQISWIANQRRSEGNMVRRVNTLMPDC